MYVPQLLGVLLLTAIYLAGVAFSSALQSAIPGSVYGLMACAVAMYALPPLRKRIRPGALLLLGLIPLFLVPVLLRMAVRVDFGSAATWIAILMLTIAALLGIAATGLFARLLLRGGDGE